MMIKTVLFFVLLLLSVWLGVQLQHDPGYIMVAINHWTVETTLWVGIAFLLITFLLMHLVFNFFSWIKNLSSSIGYWRLKRRIRASHSKTQQGLLEFCEGNWQRSVKSLVKGLPDADTPLFNYLLASWAAQEMGDSQKRDDFLHNAKKQFPEAKVAVEIKQAQLQMLNHQEQQACALLEHLRVTLPNHPYVLQLLCEVYQKMQNWQQLVLLLPQLKSAKVVKGEAYEQLQSHVFLQALKALITSGDSESIQAFFYDLPRHLAESPEFVRLFARFLLNKEDSVVELHIRQSLRKAYDDSLILLYGEIRSLENIRTRIDFAESLLKKQPHSAALHLCLGNLNQLQHAWGKAKTHYEESIKCAATPEAYAKLGALLEELGDSAHACAAYRDGLALCLMQDSDLFSC